MRLMVIQVGSTVESTNGPIRACGLDEKEEGWADAA